MANLYMYEGRQVSAEPGLSGAIQLAMYEGKLRTFQSGDTPLKIGPGGSVVTEQEPQEVVYGRVTDGDTLLPTSDNRAFVDRVTTTADGTLVEMSAWFSAATASGGQWKGVIYADNAGLPGNFLHATSVATGGPNQQTAAFAGVVTLPAGTYWIGIVTLGIYAHTKGNAGTAAAPNMQLWSDNSFSSPINWGTSTATYALEYACALTILVGGELPVTPVNTAAPTVSGSTAAGSLLSCTTGTWTGTPTPTYAYQWRAAGVDVSGATSSTYTSLTAQAGQAMTCRVTATNIAGSASEVSSNSVTVTSAPVNNVAPAITGSAAIGNLLTCSTGTWYAGPTATYTYQWRRDGSNISGATSSTYTTVNPADAGASITCRVTATNSEGSAFQDSNSVTIVSTSVFGNNVTPDGGFPGNANRALISQFTKSGVGNISAIRAFFRADTVAGANAKVFVLSDSSGSPGNILLSTAGVAVPAGGGWVDFPVPGDVSAVNASGTYWLGVVNDNFQANPGKEASGAANGTRMANGTFSYASPPNWPGTDGSYSGIMAIYCEY